MEVLIIMVSLLFTAFGQVTSQESLPSCDNGVLDATNRGLTRVPDPNICVIAPLRLDMMYNNLGILTARSFIGYTRLVFLNLSDCKLTGVEPGAFEQTHTIRDLDLSHNNLTNLEDWYFGPLRLQTLIIQHCGVVSIKPGAFGESFGELTDLDLSYNDIPYLERLVFVNLSKLKSLNLSGNRLENLDRKLFASNVELSFIDLSDNKLNYIHKDIFAGISSLRRLIISRNQIFPDPLVLQLSSASTWVDLANCSLTVMPLILLSDPAATNAISVDISGNFIHCGCGMTAEEISGINCFDGRTEMDPCPPTTDSGRMSTIDPEVGPPEISDNSVECERDMADKNPRVANPDSKTTVLTPRPPTSVADPEVEANYGNLKGSPNPPTDIPDTNSFLLAMVVPQFVIFIVLVVVIIVLIVDRKRRKSRYDHASVDCHTSGHHDYGDVENSQLTMV